MLAHTADVIKLLRSKIGRRIGILVFIQIFFLVTSLVILSHYQSQMTYLGNSINIAGKNRFLSSNLMYNTAEFYLLNSNDISNINSNIKELETNILTLTNGGKISDIELKPLPSQFSKDWDNVYQKWISLKTMLSNNILKESQTSSSKILKVIVTPKTSASSSLSSELEINKIMKTIKENGVIPLVNASNVLVTKLGEYAKDSSENSIFLQRLFAVLNIGVTITFILYIIRKLLKPIFALTTATVEVKRGNLNVLIKNKVKGGDELSFLIYSFNSMITSIKNYIKKQNELQKELKKANEELKYRDQLKDEFINVAAHELKTPLQPIVGLCELLSLYQSHFKNRYVSKAEMKF